MLTGGELLELLLMTLGADFFVRQMGKRIVFSILVLFALAGGTCHIVFRMFADLSVLDLAW